MSTDIPRSALPTSELGSSSAVTAGAATPPPADTGSVALAPQRKLVWWRFRKHKLAMLGLIITLFIYLVALFGDFLAPYNAGTFDEEGFALKLHQRAWALQRGLTSVTWTFDPLVRRNAYFNLVKLGAHPRQYLVDFYGDIDDTVNTGQGSDRLLANWQLTLGDVVDACAGRPLEALPDQLNGSCRVIVEAASGLPEVTEESRWRDEPRLLVQVPADIEELRRIDSGVAKRWRLAVRHVLGRLIEDGARVTGFSRSGWYVVDRTAR